MKHIHPIYFLYFLSLGIFLLPSINVGGYYTYQAAKLLIVILFIYLTLKKKVSFADIEKKEIYLFSFYIIAQLFSIMSAININAYADKAKNILFLLLFYMCSIIILKDKKTTKKYTLLVILLSLTSSLIVLFLSYYRLHFIDLLGNILHPSLIERMLAHLDNSKIFWESYEEISIPLIFFFASSTLQAFSSVILIVIAVIATNFRTRVLMLIISFISSMLFIKTKFNKKLLLSIIALTLLGTTLISFYRSGIDIYIAQNSIPVIDRFLLSDKNDINSLMFRQNQIYNSLELFSKNILTGVGLGNYPDHSSNQIRNLLIGTSGASRTSYVTAIDPHNIFFSTLAESGLLGIISLLAFLFFLIKKDMPHIKDAHLRPYIFAFWTLFIYSLFNPSDGLTYNVLFLSLRAIL